MTVETANYEKKLVAIVRRLPAERGKQLLDFARFLAFETFNTIDLDFLNEVVATEGDAKWGTLFASDGGQTALDQLADEALATIKAGASTPIYERIIKSI
ncbi:MAG: hypothetical protein R3C62_05210 [Chloroflexota bacterium]